MRIRKFCVLLGLALGPAFGAALGLSPAATAAETPLDAWPDYVQDYYPAGPPTNVVGPAYDQTYDQAYNVTITGGGTFSTHTTESAIPAFYDYSSQNVFASDGLAPPIGTTMQQFSGLDYLSPGGLGLTPALVTGSENVPDIGSISNFLLFGYGFGYVSDSAGIEGYLESPGAITPLFIIPASDTVVAALSGAGAASDLGDGFQQLLAELGTLF